MVCSRQVCPSTRQCSWPASGKTHPDREVTGVVAAEERSIVVVDWSELGVPHSVPPLHLGVKGRWVSG